MQLNTLHELFVHILQDLYSVETQLVDALPKMVEAVSSEELRKGLELHLEETQKQVERLENISQKLNFTTGGHNSSVMLTMIEHANEIMTSGGEASVVDAALIGAAQKVEHYEIAAYGTAIALAEVMKHEDVIGDLQESLAEEKSADELLTQVAQDNVNPQAMESASGHEE